MINSMSDLVDYLKNRARNVLYSSFVISFLIVNWRPIYVLLFGDMNTLDKLSFVDNHYASFWCSLLLLLALPLVIAAVHIYAISYISEKVFEKWTRHQTKMSDIAIGANNKKVLTVEAAQRIRKENAELKLELDELKSVHIEELRAISKTEGEQNMDIKDIDDSLNVEKRLNKMSSSEYSFLDKNVYSKILNASENNMNSYHIGKKYSAPREKFLNFQTYAKSLGFQIRYSNYDYGNVWVEDIRWK